MIDTKKTKEQERAREQRVIEHARAGRTMTEIVDLEGLDAGNVKKWHRFLRDAGVTIEMARASNPPSGLRRSNDTWRYNIGRSLGRMRDQLPQIEVSRLVGMTNIEINSAIKTSPTHNWTVSQLQRLADAQGVSFQDLIEGSFHRVVKENYK